MKYLHTRKWKGKLLLYWFPNKKYFVDGKWQACPIKGGKVKSLEEAEDKNRRLDDWRAGKNPVLVHYEKGMVGWLVGEYKKDERFTALAPGTQALYQFSFNELLKTFGDFPIEEVTRKRVREFYKSFAGTVRKQSQIMQNCRVVFSFARDEELITDNPFAEQRVVKAKPRQGIIAPEAIAAAKAKAVALGLPSIARAIQIAYDGGQRPGDIRTLPLSAYDGKWLQIKQAKTGAVVDIPVYKMPSLKAGLDAINHDSLLLIHEERTGKSYNKDMLCRRVREVFKAAGIDDNVQFRDLRRTAVVRLAEAGCTLPEICSITGHSLKEATEILKVYLPMSRAMAENAADKVHKLNEK